MTSKHQASTQDALCCCEYESHEGDRSHILTTFCDCEALDNTCDKILRCEKIPEEMREKLSRTMTDRLRIPWFRGGAVKLDPEVCVPVCAIPFFLAMATIGKYSMFLCLFSLPAIIIVQYRIWTRRKKKPQSRIFLVWGLLSSWLMFFLFFVVVYPISTVPMWQVVTFTALYFVMMIALYHAKKDPGYVKHSPYCEPVGSDERVESIYNSSLQHIQNAEESSAESPSQNESKSADSSIDYGDSTSVIHEEMGPVGEFLISRLGFNKEGFLMAAAQKKAEEVDIVEDLTEKDVTWVDSRAIEGGVLRTWCRTCRLKKPPRSGHCPVCQTCILGRDHHCVWINNCIGSYNHRAFLLAIVIFVLGGYYGAYVSLTTICPPTVYMEVFAVPSTCSFPFPSFKIALVYVSAWYTCIACSGMALVLGMQLVLVAQNVTSQELHYAGKRGWTCCFLFAYNNINNHGILRNFWDFARGRRKYQHYYGTFAV